MGGEARLEERLARPAGDPGDLALRAGRRVPARRASRLGDSIAAFMRDIEDRADDVLLVTLTDFGRTAAENGTSGTDHGWANCMLLAGGPVARAGATAGAPPSWSACTWATRTWRRCCRSTSSSGWG